MARATKYVSAAVTLLSVFHVPSAYDTSKKHRTQTDPGDRIANVDTHNLQPITSRHVAFLIGRNTWLSMRRKHEKLNGRWRFIGRGTDKDRQFFEVGVGSWLFGYSNNDIRVEKG